MRRLLSSRDSDWMRKLYQYLRQQGMPVSVTERGEQLELWLYQSSYEAAAKTLIQQFKDNPELVAGPAQERPAATSHSTPLSLNLLKQSGWLTRIVAVLTVLVFMAVQVSPETILNTLKISRYFAALPYDQPWRFITPVLMHFTALHLIFNLFWWWYLGGRIERSLGTSWLLALLLFCGITANVIQYLFNGPNFGGLSGVVYGLLGFCWLYSFNRPTPLYLPQGLIIFMLLWLVVGYTDMLWVNVANEAHLAGLLSGCLAGVVVRWLNPKIRQLH
ncbi:rhomboid family intramembrane serine protease [Idiomarina aminovorans]|uniref:rhomboid family intramembrane serine protease n=1 Tax=Idiomarina aminovorans TaxID=2914829 RepID=UPI00200334A8|nr:rhomboid family intramembrane serine protease [Idiomarina sp. ATCH4]MCK7458869.1 rhomboid family intramembrane serine protease [Idiomarina sp. ATCH4]